ncbi:MAG TPA: type II secretion system protein [Alphaproteobacteria bacterium]|nr:type II secretion system protein [Alphaproteobacteria bacterium]HAJ47020.1 type II secretion system protein [Alphaproteobacteria bacterium]
MSYVNLLFDQEFVVSLLAALAAFATILTLAYPMMEQDRLGNRLKAVAERREELRRQAREALNQRKQGSLRSTPVGFMKQTIEQLNLRNLLESPGSREKLVRAGYRGQAPLYMFMFFRFVMPFVVFGGALFYLFVVSKWNIPPVGKLGLSFLAGFIGFYLPDLYVQNVIDKRMKSVMGAFPDSLDLLLICIESGMSAEHAFNKVAGEIGTSSVELAEELALTTAELSYLPDRRQAYENLAKRCLHPGVKAVCTSLIQAERYGTPLGTALRVMAQENREMRMAEAEKIAASLPAKLTVPMILFFLPALFVVILGPAAIKLMETFK